jgi:hypothetical protein
VPLRPAARAAAGLLTAAAVLAWVAAAPTASAAPPDGAASARQGGDLAARGEGVARRSASLSAALRTALATSGFDDLVDFGPVEGRCPAGGGCPDAAPVVEHPPTLDAAVLELDDAGRVVAVANAVLSRDVPGGAVVEVGADLAARSVRWHRWDEQRWSGATAWDAPWPAGDLLAPAPAATLDVMSPYPGTLFALVVAVQTLRLADAGTLDLDAPYSYRLGGDRTCLDESFSATATTRTLLDRAVTSGDHAATCMLLAQLHERDAVGTMNDWLQQVGLRTIHVDDTDPVTGGRWTPGRITMTALDTARLLLLVRGASGPLWDDADGRPVRPDDVLAAPSRALLLRLLGEQGFDEALSTTNWCGRDDVPRGIPQAVAPRWVDPAHGTVTVGGVPYGQDVRPCNAAAEVTFAHKTATTYTFGADAGIVEALPGERSRHYVVAVLGTLGSRFADPRFATSPTLPCDTDTCFTGALARLGAAVDAAVGDRQARPAGTTQQAPRAAQPDPRRDPKAPSPRLRRAR